MTKVMMPIITADSQVTLHFAVCTEAGEEIDSTFARQPAQLSIGDGNLPPHFESCLIHLQPGDHRIFTMLPEQAFGQHNKANIKTMKRHQFGTDMVLELGLVVSFADVANSELPGVIQSIDGDEVMVDFNHPLAGMTLQFEVEIIEVSAAS